MSDLESLIDNRNENLNKTQANNTKKQPDKVQDVELNYENCWILDEIDEPEE